MHAIRNVADRDTVFQLARRESGPHSARDFAVQRGYSIRAPRESQAKHRHAERFIDIWVFTSKRHETFLRETQSIPQGTEVLLQQVGSEAVMPGWYGSMGCENNLA